MECFNRIINREWPNAHPSLLTFAKGLESHIDERVLKYEEYIDKNATRNHATINFPSIPDYYDTWSAGVVHVSLDEDAVAAQSSVKVRSVKKRACKKKR